MKNGYRHASVRQPWNTRAFPTAAKRFHIILSHKIYFINYYYYYYTHCFWDLQSARIYMCGVCTGRRVNLHFFLFFLLVCALVTRRHIRNPQTRSRSSISPHSIAVPTHTYGINRCVYCTDYRVIDWPSVVTAYFSTTLLSSCSKSDF